MQTREWHYADKSEWGPGPWVDEPDKLQWQDEATGLPCLIKRNTQVTGALCGYVGLAEGHPDFGKSYHDVEVEVHGGLTFADFCHKSDEQPEHELICHMHDPGEPDRVWWLGFDCSHAGDLSPRLDSVLRSLPAFPKAPGGWEDTYRAIDYVKAHVTQLAAQLAKRAHK
jgi:hypothetical protein